MEYLSSEASALRPEITITGFPKCGTSALFRYFEDDPAASVLRTPSGAMEVAWPAIREVRRQAEEGRILVHKFTAYVYLRPALEYLVNVNPEGLLVLCVRDPLLALISWHNMHQRIARSGTNTEHFAWKEREFYAECNISDYYARFARERLQYDKHLIAMLSVVPRERLAVVSQERLAEDMSSVAGYLKALSRGDTIAELARTQEAGRKHEGFADKAEVAVDAAIEQELEGVRSRLSVLLTKEIVHKCI